MLVLVAVNKAALMGGAGEIGIALGDAVGATVAAAVPALSLAASNSDIARLRG